MDYLETQTWADAVALAKATVVRAGDLPQILLYQLLIRHARSGPDLSAKTSELLALRPLGAPLYRRELI